MINSGSLKKTCSASIGSCFSTLLRVLPSTRAKRVKGLMRAKRGTPEGDYLDVLVTLVEAIDFPQACVQTR
jgi:hypothetical protein